MDKRFIGSNIAIAAGVIAIIAGLASPSSVLFSGIVILLGALAYQSAKRRKLGIKGSFGKVAEYVILGLMLLILILQKDYWNQAYTDPIPYLIAPLLALIAYLIAVGSEKSRFVPYVVFAATILVGFLTNTAIYNSGNNYPASYQPVSPTESATQPQPTQQQASAPTQSNSNAVDLLAMKQKCSQDGQRYFQNTILSQYTPGSEVIQLDAQAGITNVVVEQFPTFAYNQAMNTCLIDYTTDETIAGHSGNSYSKMIEDIYTNKGVTSITVLPDGTVLGYVGETQQIFDANEQNLMVNGQECVGGNGNC